MMIRVTLLKRVIKRRPAPSIGQGRDSCTVCGRPRQFCAC